MANIKQIKQEALAIIDAALAILNRFPELNDTNIQLSFNTSANPFPFLMDALKSVIGYNKIISIIAKFIAWELPAVELAVKGLLIAKLKDTISCSVNPFLTEEILRDGITFNINEIDLIDTFRYSPFDKKVGYLYYMGVEPQEVEEGKDDNGNPIVTKKVVLTPDDLIKSDDLNCLLWFMINRANKRYVWKPTKNRQDDEFRIGYPHNKPEEKLKKEDGIITLEFNERALNLKNAYGGDYYKQTPYNNILHVFIGDTREKYDFTKDIRFYEQELIDIESQNDKFTSNIRDLGNEIANLEQQKIDLDEQLQKNIIIEKDYAKQLKKINKKIQSKKDAISNLRRWREESYARKNRFQNALAEAKNTLQSAKDAYFPFSNKTKNRNYYYGKTLIEFNIDYITSLKLFDAKSLAAKLIDSLTAVLSIDLGLTYKQQLIKNEVTKMVQMITESDDLVVSDCFFTFSNDDYDAMSRKAELRKAGLLTLNGDELSAVKLNAEDVLAGLNSINKSATQEEMQTVIEGTITELSKQLTNTDYEIHDKVNFSAQMNFIEQLLNNLAYALVISILSPKVYLLLLINLKIIGRESNFNLEEFIGQYKQLIADLIRMLRDQLLSYLQKELMAIISDLVKEVTVKLTVEQARYYARLIKKLIDCFKKFRSLGLDFQIDHVDYADILSDNTDEPQNSDC